MATLDERRIQEIVERVVSRLGTAGAAGATASPAMRHLTTTHSAAEPPRTQPKIPAGRMGSYDSIDAAVEAARRGFEQNEKLPLDTRRKMIHAMREVTRAHVKELSQYAVDESTYGR